MRLPLPGLCLLLLPTIACAQQWRTSMLSTNFTGASACESPDGRGVVVVSRYEGRVHQWEPGGYRFRPTSHTPTMPYQNVDTAVLDPVRRVVVALVRAPNGTFDSLQEFDGSGWRVVATRSLPMVLFETVAMAYDGRAGAVSILYADARGQTLLHNWNGQTMTTVPGPATIPSDLQWAVAFDASRSRLVATNMSNTSRLYEWNGTSWTTVNTITAARRSNRNALCYDAAVSRILMLEDPTLTANGRLLAYDGTDWTVLGLAQSRLGFPHLVHVPGQGTMVMLGNYSPGTDENLEIWQWAAGVWTKVESAHRPDARALRMAGAYDSARNRFVCFHPGLHLDISGAGISETWEWDGFRWFLRATGTSLSPVLQGIMAYDAARQETVLFNSNTASGSTWLWNGSTWRAATTPVSPPHRDNGGIAYDQLRQQVVLFGGNSANLGNLNDTWVWNGAVWTQLTPATSPPPSAGVGMAYDEARGVVVAVCSTNGLGPTCEWNGTNWVQRLAPGLVTPPAPSLAYDRSRQRIQMHGQGLQMPLYEWTGAAWVQRSATRETWVESDYSPLRLFFDEQTNLLSRFSQHEVVQLTTSTPTTTLVLIGCSGRQPVPGIGQFGEARLQRSDYELEVIAGGHPLAPALMGLGSRPGFVAIAGCTMAMLDVELLWPMVLDQTGHGRISLPIPADPWFLGRTFRVQALVADGTATSGAAVSSAIELRIGS